MKPPFGSRATPRRRLRVRSEQIQSRPHRFEEEPLLYFAYDANIEPRQLKRVAPGAAFEFIAHLPEWKMTFPIRNGDGGLPSVHPEPGNTVWGAVFTIDGSDLEALNEAEETEGRIPAEVQAMDREGKRHPVVTHVMGGSPNGEYDPEPAYIKKMVDGGRHWKLPAGWVMSLEEHLEGF
ncbi:MAG: gamma-glutamylcyclotransferase [Acidimicrobiia bacterium]|nr:gamma-glutamylcyclotransferase [Acidimicrobiia bacterium]